MTTSAGYESLRIRARVSRLAVITAVGLALAACGGGHNHDPRKGRVVTSDSNCFTGDCTYDFKVCIGPDLLVHISDAQPEDHTIKNSRECAP